MKDWVKGAIVIFFIVYVSTIIIFLILDPIRVVLGLILGALLPIGLYTLGAGYGGGQRLPSWKEYGIIFFGASLFTMLFLEVVFAIMNFFEG